MQHRHLHVWLSICHGYRYVEFTCQLCPLFIVMWNFHVNYVHYSWLCGIYMSTMSICHGYVDMVITTVIDR